ncbi:MAG TPA: DUF1874 domain-containing protein [Burkholderiales bacterium]|nr:DUF1874 domain-containing protein [Burkholderiales bacterium]
MKKVTILNTSILTNYGYFRYQRIGLDWAKAIVQDEFESAVGHQSTCDVLSALLEINVPLNRQMYKQEVGDTALVFKLNGRPEEGKILTVEEIEQMGYEFGLLTRVNLSDFTTTVSSDEYFKD